MNSETFVEAVERYVRDAAIEDTIANLKNPPGRHVSEQMSAPGFDSSRPKMAVFRPHALVSMRVPGRKNRKVV
jgi:hypothetical protein